MPIWREFELSSQKVTLAGHWGVLVRDHRQGEQMRQRRWITAAVASVTALLASGGLLGVSAPAAVAGPAAATSRALSNSSIAFPDLVSQTPVADCTNHLLCIHVVREPEFNPACLVKRL